MDNKQQEQLREEISDKLYSLMFDKSDVDIVRIAYEDKWPIDEMTDYVISKLQEQERLIEEAIEEYKPTNI